MQRVTTNRSPIGRTRPQTPLRPAVSFKTSYRPSFNRTALPEAVTDEQPSSPPPLPQNTAKFLGALVTGAFAGAAVVKYGSLLTDVAFTPNPALALAIVFTPPVTFAAWMLSRSNISS